MGGVALALPGKENPWGQIALHRFSAARLAFAAEPPTRETRLGEAVALLNAQPKTAQNIQTAMQYLEAIAAEQSTDDLGLTARYLRARIEHVHLTEPRPAIAAKRYREIMLDAPPGHPLASQSAVKLALIILYANTNSSLPADRIQDVEQLLGGVKQKEARRDLHLLLGRGYLFFDLSPERALQHLEAAWAAGIGNRVNRGDTLLAIAQLAEGQGQVKRAKEAFDRFLAENPRDDRAHSVRMWLAGDRSEGHP